MPYVIVVANQKGGVSKTTVATNLAFAAAEEGKRVLAIDLDTQSNMTLWLTDRGELAEQTGGSATLFDPSAALDISHTERGIDVLHGHRHLDDLDSMGYEETLALKDRVRALPYDVIIFDTPPAPGIRQISPLFWADRLVVPLPPEELSVAATEAMMAVRDTALEINPDLRTTVVLSRVKHNARSHKEFGDSLREIFGDECAKTALHDRIAVADASAARRPVWKTVNAAAEIRNEWRDFAEEIFA